MGVGVAFLSSPGEYVILIIVENEVIGWLKD